MSLHEIQEEMRKALLCNDGRGLQKFLSSNEDRTEVYTLGFRHRLFDGLKSDYPQLYTLLGEAVFEEVAEDFVTQRPSVMEGLGEYNGLFADHVKNFFNSPENGEMLKTFPWAADLALWEWLPIKSFFNHLSCESGLELNPELPWQMRKGLYIYKSDWNFFEKKPIKQKTWTAIFTKNESSRKVVLSEDESRWLEFFSEPRKIEEFLEFAETPITPTPESITQFFTNCSQYEWLVNAPKKRMS